MNNRSEQQRLLAEVLGESAPMDFRAALLGETLIVARRRRQWRRIRQTAGTLVVLLLGGILLWRPATDTITKFPPVVKIAGPDSFHLVETLPLPAGAVVVSKDFAGVKTIFSTPGVVEFTSIGGGYRLLNDAQLLVLLDGHPAVLIRTGPDSEELVFANAADNSLFMNHEPAAQ